MFLLFIFPATASLLKYWCKQIYTKRPINRTYANSADPERTPHNAESDQGLHCLLTKISIRNQINQVNMKKYKPDTAKIRNRLVHLNVLAPNIF